MARVHSLRSKALWIIADEKERRGEEEEEEKEAKYQVKAIRLAVASERLSAKINRKISSMEGKLNEPAAA